MEDCWIQSMHFPGCQVVNKLAITQQNRATEFELARTPSLRRCSPSARNSAKPIEQLELLQEKNSEHREFPR